MTPKTRVAAILAALAVAASVLLGLPVAKLGAVQPSAQADASVCNAVGCGVVTNVGSTTILVYCDYGSLTAYSLIPGKTSTSICPDVDQYNVPTGYVAADKTSYRTVYFYGPQRVKISSLPWAKRIAISRR